MNNNQPQDFIEGLTRSLLMEAIEQQIEQRRKQLTVNSQQLEVNSKLSVDSKLLTDKEIEYCLEKTKDLINAKYEAWYRLRLYRLGVSEYMERAEKARKFGKNPTNYFSYILKR